VKEKVEEQLMTFFPPPVFTMTDFEQHKKDGDDWFSPPFYSHAGGYKMGLSVDANGHGSGKDGCIYPLELKIEALNSCSYNSFEELYEMSSSRQDLQEWNLCIEGNLHMH